MHLGPNTACPTLILAYLPPSFLVGFQIASSLGIVLLSIPVGMLFDAFGYHFVFYLFSAIVSVILLFGGSS